AIGAAGQGVEVGIKEAGLNSIGGDEGKFLRTSIAGIAGGTASVLTGGKFANGAVSAAFAHLFNQEGHPDEATNAAANREKIAADAEAQVGSKDWSYASSANGWPANWDKCNLFVYDIATGAGAYVPMISGWTAAITGVFLGTPMGFSPPTASQ